MYSVIIFLFFLSSSLQTYSEGRAYSFHIDADVDEARRILEDHCFTMTKHIENLENFYLAIFNNRVDCGHPVHDLGGRIKRDDKIIWHAEDVERKREKRGNFVIPERYSTLWYMNNGGRHGYDMALTQVWDQNINGKGVVIAILDDGVQKDHGDLRENFDLKASYDFVDDDSDPEPFPLNAYNSHGTRCAGVAAGTGERCGVGAAFRSRVAGIRILSDTVKDSVEAQGLLHMSDYISIYSSSWGPTDNGMTIDGPHKLTLEAFKKGLANGRGGKGSIYIWSSGNGGLYHDSCSFDGYVNHFGTLAVGSVTKEGTKPRYLEMCSAVMVSSFSGGFSEAISTTDLNDECTNSFSGTSPSAPMVAGIVALALQERPDLTWRDIQHISLRSTVTEFIHDGEWVINGVGRKYSHLYGYGLVSASRFVFLSKKWPGVGRMRTCKQEIASDLMFSVSKTVKFTTNGCLGTNFIAHVENLLAIVTMNTTRRGCLEMTILSPAKTKSTLIFPRKFDNAKAFTDLTLLSVTFWGENPSGDWFLTVTNTCKDFTYIDSVSMVMHGTFEEPPFLEKYHDPIDSPKLVMEGQNGPLAVNECPYGYYALFYKCIYETPSDKDTDCRGHSPELIRCDVWEEEKIYPSTFFILFGIVFGLLFLFVVKFLGFSFNK